MSEIGFICLAAESKRNGSVFLVKHDVSLNEITYPICNPNSEVKINVDLTKNGPFDV